MLCGGERFVPSDPKLRGGYYMTPCVLGETSVETLYNCFSLCNILTEYFWMNDFPSVLTHCSLFFIPHI